MEMTRRRRALIAAVGVAGAFAAGYATRHLLGSDAGAPGPAPVPHQARPAPPTPPTPPAPPVRPGPAVTNEDTRPRKPAVRPLEGWKRCMEIVLSNPGRTIEDYTVRLDLPRADGMLPDCRDLRFTDAGRPLPFWIEKTGGDPPAGGDGVAAWVRFPEIAKGRTKVLLSYDNPRAARASPPAGGSDGEAAFLFFDDFDSGFDGDKWRRNRDASGGGAGAFVRDGVMHVQGGDNSAKGWLKSLVDFPNRVAVESRWKVERKIDHCKGGLRLRGQGQGKLPPGRGVSVGVDYNFFSYERERVTFANRDSFAIHYNDFPNPERAGVKLPGFWRKVWFRQRLAYDGTSAARNLVYARDKGGGLERLAADVPQTRSSVRISIDPWAWGSWPTQFFQIDWIAARNYAPARIEVTVCDPEGGNALMSVFDDVPPDKAEVTPGPVEVAPEPEYELEVF